MTRWKLTIEYDGTGFSGWQKQNNAPSIQQTIEQAILKFSGEETALFVAGRTDAGVHARAQCAHFDLSKDFPAGTICDAINFHVKPNRISILRAEAVDAAFHARHSALGRVYLYRILNRRAQPALDDNYAWHVKRPLNLPAMQQAAALLIGKHDFSTFRAQDCQSQSPVKTLDRLDITQHGENIFFDVAARSFLYHQVRNMVGTVAMVGNGNWTLDQFRAAFAARDRTKGGPMAPACGLYFMSVSYPQFFAFIHSAWIINALTYQDNL